MAEERSVITTEAARIRTAFKEEAGTYRHRNVAKILFISMLGYPSHFSHMECLKLIASTRFAEKRIGYLGLMLLLRGDEEVLTLVTNSIQQDLGSTNQFVVGIALTAMGNMASEEMCRDLFGDVDQALRSSTHSFGKRLRPLACAWWRSCQSL